MNWTPEPLVAMNSPVIELPAIARPIFQPDQFVLRTPPPPPPSQPRGEQHGSTKSNVIEFPVFPQPALPLSDDPFYSPAPLASAPTQPIAVVAHAAEAAAADHPDVIEISSDEEDDDAPPAKRVRRETSAISIVYSEDEVKSNSSNKENVPCGKAPSSPPPYVLIPYPPKTIIERRPPVQAAGSTLSTADKLRAILSRSADSKPILQTSVVSHDGPADADAAAQALFLKLVQHVPSNILQETVVKMNAELVQRGEGVESVKEEEVAREGTPKDVLKREDDSGGEDDDDDAGSLFSRARSESWEADVLISNAGQPFADIYTNETECLPRADRVPAVSLNIRARWELRVIIWYRVSECLQLGSAVIN